MNTKRMPLEISDSPVEQSEWLEQKIASLECELREKGQILRELLERGHWMESDNLDPARNFLADLDLHQEVAKTIDEIGSKNRALEGANRALQMDSSDHLQKEKLESIGRLAAGVAHEINTPVQYVSDSVHFINEGITDLFSLIEALDAVIQEAGASGALSQETLADVGEAKEKLDLEYLQKNLPKAVVRATEGLGRVGDIVRSMKEFAHPDRVEMAPMNVNRMLASTLAIAKHEYKYVADVETSFEEVPPVNCHAGEINQVFLNIIVNAAHAIQDQMDITGQRGKIQVRTRADAKFVVVEIQDSGGGIPDSIKEKVFDPFFTTKEVGRGTGQGLAISHKVVQTKHHGHLTFDSVPGVGTTFLIKLPIFDEDMKSESEAVAA